MAVSETPQWASGASNPNTPPVDAADYADFMRDMAARYNGRVVAWEVWNEPNHPRFWNPAPDPAGYARLLTAAYPAVKAGDPAAKVLFGGIAHNDYEYLEDVYAADPGIGDSFDVMATHPYTAGGQSPADVDRDEAGRMTTTSFRAFGEVRDVMRDHGDLQPIWLTEFGWSTNSNVQHPLGGVTEAQQADYLAQAFELLEATPYVEVAIVYNFRNNYWADDADNWEDQLGLLRTDFSPKPAYAVFKDYGAPSGDPQPPAEQAAVQARGRGGRPRGTAGGAAAGEPACPPAGHALRAPPGFAHGEHRTRRRRPGDLPRARATGPCPRRSCPHRGQAARRRYLAAGTHRTRRCARLAIQHHGRDPPRRAPPRRSRLQRRRRVGARATRLRARLIQRASKRSSRWSPRSS